MGACLDKLLQITTVCLRQERKKMLFSSFSDLLLDRTLLWEIWEEDSPVFPSPLVFSLLPRLLTEK